MLVAMLSLLEIISRMYDALSAADFERLLTLAATL
jgi:hypothetical protein